MHFVPDADDPGALLAACRDVIAPGGAMTLSRITDRNPDEQPCQDAALRTLPKAPRRRTG